jgi:hypothetical protein
LPDFLTSPLNALAAVIPQTKKRPQRCAPPRPPVSNLDWVVCQPMSAPLKLYAGFTDSSRPNLQYQIKQR